MFEREIAEGASFLDARYPEWEKRIDKETLNVGRSDTCVLKQVAGSYHGGLNALAEDKYADAYHELITYDSAYHWLDRVSVYGFSIGSDKWDEAMEDTTDPYDLLTHEWKEYIKQRLTSET